MTGTGMDEPDVVSRRKDVTPEASASSRPQFLWALTIIGGVALGAIFYDGLLRLVDEWASPEYSHGYLIPVVSAALFGLYWPRLRQAKWVGSWWGVALVAVALTVAIAGQLGTIYLLVQLAFVLALVGVALSFFGWSGLAVIWFPLVYLVFMIPLPDFLQVQLSAELQLIASSLGVAFVRLFDISVFLDGNIIDLGTYQLQVVEACSGLRYLFPLLSFGFLIAYFYRGPLWQRAVIFVSTVPITILMNSFRIGVIGVLVEYYGIEMAEGFFHDFDGWVIFMACTVILFVEIWLFVLFDPRKRPLSELFWFGAPRGV